MGNICVPRLKMWIAYTEVLVVEVNNKQSGILGQKGVTEEDVRTEKWAVKTLNLLASQQDPLTPLVTRAHVAFDLVTLSPVFFYKIKYFRKK